MYLWGIILKRSIWFYATPLLIIFSALFITLASMGMYVYKTRRKLRLGRFRGILFAIASIFSLISIYYGVFINPIYRYFALAIPTVVITEIFLLVFAWAGSITMRKLHIHKEKFQPLIDFEMLKPLRRNRIIDIVNKWIPERIREKRRFPRLEVPLSMMYKIADLNIWNRSLTKDISAGGVQFFTSKELTKDTRLELMMKVEDDVEPIHISGKVIWTEAEANLAIQSQLKRYRVGFKFERPDPFLDELRRANRDKISQEIFQIKNTKHINRAQMSGALLSMLCLVFSPALIWGIANHKDWVIHISTSFFVLLVLSCYFSFGLIAIIAKKL
jgi:hypothetical protein